MFAPKNTFAALAVIAHYLTAVTAAPMPGNILTDIVNGINNAANDVANLVGEAFSTDFVTGLLTKDISTTKGAPSTISGSEFSPIVLY